MLGEFRSGKAELVVALETILTATRHVGEKVVLVDTLDDSSRLFASPSSATAVVAGRNSNGRTEWTVQGSGKSYADWQTEGIDSALSDDPQ